MSQGNELEELAGRASGVVSALITASSQLALALIELRIQQLRQAAQRDQETVRAVRDRTRVYQQADAVTWGAAMRPQWWRRAGAEDISRVWRAASTWQHVDPRAAEAREVVIERLAERGVRVDPAATGNPSPEDVAWLSDALDQAAADRAAADRAARGEAENAADRAESDPGAATVIDGDVAEHVRPRQPSAREREQKAAEHVRTVWPPERADRVLACKAWSALAHQLGQLEEQGHDVEALLAGVPAFIDRAHTPAAFAVRSIADHLEGRVDLGTTSSDAASSSRSSREQSEPDRAPTDAAVVVAGDPVAAAPETMQPRAEGVEKTAEAGAAQVAAQAYPQTTKDAVAAAAERAETGGASVVAVSPVVITPAREEPLSR